jgi:vacuolar iron transporter family protein
MTESKELERWRASFQEEIEAAALYRAMSEVEGSPEVAEVYRRMATVEEQHAEFWSRKLEAADAPVPPHRLGWRTRALIALGRRFGPGLVLPALMGNERRGTAGYSGRGDAKEDAMAAQERSHGRLLGMLAGGGKGLAGSDLARLEGRHRGGGGNTLRAAVLGANDGLCSNLSLVMGVAGANLAPGAIVVTGLAGLLAGASSMALGEWLSVQSSRELYEHQIEIEAEELAAAPEEEAAELALIYQAKGLPEAQARELARAITADYDTALATLAREELGIDPEELGGSAWVAALTSFLLFAGGAIVPLVPFLLLRGTQAVLTSLAAAVVGLFGLGAASTLLTGRSVLLTGFRGVALGLLAAGLTYGIGHLLGVAITG